jgi:hypothetical protein
MATVNKDFKIKSGLIVEGTTATVNGYDILTKKQADQDFIVDIIGGETLVKSVSNEFDVSVAGELSIDRATVDAYYDAAGSASTAQSNAEDYADGLAVNYDAAGSASAAQTAAQGYADGLAVNYDAAGAAATAQSNAEDYADGLAVNYDAAGSASAAQTAAQGYADGLAANYDSVGSAAQALSDANDYTDTAVGNLVGAAPELLNTLEELATALENNPDIIADLESVASGKQDTLTAGSNIDITGATISVTGLDSADISDFSTAAVTANTGLWDTVGAAATAQSNAEDYADGLAVNYDAAGAAATAETNAIAHADALTTDDVAEGTTQYFTDARAKTSAADLLTGANLSNITITGTGAGLTITAENGVAGSTTDDLAEGSTNKYFTDARALTAIEDANIQPSSIDISWIRREEATWTDVNTASKVTCHSAGTSEGSMKYLVRVTAQVGGVRHSHVTEVLATVSGDNGVAVVEYGTIYTSENPLATVTVEWNAGTSAYDLNVTTANNNSEVMVAATLITALD